MEKNPKIFDYQLQLITRRWQYFATYLVIVGLFANIVPKIYWSDSTQIATNLIPIEIRICIPVIGVLIGMIFCHFISLTTFRINYIESFFTEKESITHKHMDGKFYGKSETVFTYIIIYIISVFWIALLFSVNKYIAIIMIVIVNLNLFTLKWKRPIR